MRERPLAKNTKSLKFASNFGETIAFTEKEEKRAPNEKGRSAILGDQRHLSAGHWVAGRDDEMSVLSITRSIHIVERNR